MKLKNFIKRFLLPVCILSLFVGCARELDNYANNPNQLTATNFYKTESDANKAVLGIYGYIETPFNLGIAGTEIRNQRSDEMSSVFDYSRYGQHLVGKGSSFYVSDDQYQLSYTALFAANDVLEHVPDINFTDDNLKNSYIGEARFLRAFLHFTLLINFKKVILYTKTPKTPADFIQPQADPDAVWDTIVADLQKAIVLLPLKNSSLRTGVNLGRATKGSAAGLLGKVYLYRAGMENKPQYYANAAQIFDRLIGGEFGQYTLTANYTDNFDIAHENNDESVIEFQFRADLINTSVSPGTSSSGLWFEPRTIAPPGFPVQGSGEGVNNNWVLDFFKTSVDADGNLDPRAFGSLIFNDQNIKKRPEDQVTLFDGQTFMQAYPSGKFPGKAANYTSANRKWLDFTLSAAQFQGSARANGVNYRYLRYADVLLMYAEALVQSNTASGTTSGMTALQAVNMVRQRPSVNMPPLQSVDMNSIKRERILELTNEGTRFYDLVRWGEIATRFASLEASDPYFKKFTTYIPFSPKDAVFPIPTDELNSNPLAEQNDEWK